MGARAADVLVLGGGVIGLACALALLKQGRSVTVLEQNRIGGGASHGNCGTLTPSLLPLPGPGVIAQALRWMLRADSPLLVRPTADPQRLAWLLRFAAHCNTRDFERTVRVKLPFLQHSRALTEAWIRGERLDCEFSAAGHLAVFREEQALLAADRRFRLARELGLQADLLDGRRARALEPALNDSVAGLLHTPGDAQLRPDRYAAALAAAVRKLGGVLAEQTKVQGFQTGNGRVTAVSTTAGEYQGRDLVFALGAWSPQLGAALGLRIPVQPGKGYSLTYAAHPAGPRIPMVLYERRVCVTAWTSGYRIGSTMEFAGYDATLNRARLDALSRGAAEYLRTPPATPVQEEWQGWRPMTPDDLPLIGRAPGLENLWLATGHGMLGVTLAAATGEMIGNLVCGRAGAMDPAPFSPARFS